LDRTVCYVTQAVGWLGLFWVQPFGIIRGQRGGVFDGLLGHSRSRGEPVLLLRRLDLDVGAFGWRFVLASCRSCGIALRTGVFRLLSHVLRLANASQVAEAGEDLEEAFVAHGRQSGRRDR
jgi:hypothetical protein